MFIICLLAKVEVAKHIVAVVNYIGLLVGYSVQKLLTYYLLRQLVSLSVR